MVLFSASRGPIAVSLCKPCCSDCPGLGLLDDENGQTLAVVVENATPEQIKKMAKMGLNAGKNETAGVVPISILKAFLAKLVDQTATMPPSQVHPERLTGKTVLNEQA